MAQIPQFAQPRTGDTARRIGQIGQNLITSLPGLKQKGDETDRQNQLYADAAQAAKEDWTSMTSAYKGLKLETFDKLDALLKQGAIDNEYMKSAMKSLEAPMNADKKDPTKYMQELGGALSKINQDISTKASQQRVGRAKQDVFLGTPGSPEVPEVPGQPAVPQQQLGQGVPGQAGPGIMRPPTPAQPAIPGEPGQPAISPREPATSTLDFAQGIMGREGLTDPEKQQALEQGKLLGLPTDVQLQKRTEEDSLEDVKRRKIEADTAYKIAVTNKIPGEVERAKKKVQLTQDALMNTYNRNIGSENTNILKTDSKIKKLKDKITFEENQNPDLGPGPDANIIAGYYSEIKDLNSEKENMLDKIQQLKKEKLMVGAMPGETRTAKGGGSPKPVQAPPVQSPGTTQTITTTPKVTAVSVNRDRTAVKLSDGTTMSWDEAKQKGFIK